MRLSKKALLFAAVAACGLVVGFAAAGERAAGATPSVFMAPAGAGTACTQAAPCSSVPAAYAVARAQGGAVVEMAAGTYSQVQFPGNQASSPGLVTFQPAAGAVVRWGEFRPYGADNIEVRDIQLGVYLNGTNGYTGSPASNLTFRNDRNVGPDLYVRNADHVSFIGGEVCCSGGNGVPTPTVGNGGVGSGYTRVNNVLFDGVSFHDISRANTPTEHDECLFVQGASYVTIQNSTFTNCSIMDVYLHGISGEANPDHVVLLNNHFGPMGPLAIDQGYYSVLFRADAGEAINGFHVEGNTFDQPLLVESVAGATLSGLERCGNTGSFQYTGLVPPWTDCAPGPPPTTSTAPTTTAPTTTEPPPTTTAEPPPTTTAPPPYSPACAITCDEQIADLGAQVVALQAKLDQANGDKATLQARVDALQAKIDKALADLAP